MYILHIETSTKVCSVAISRDDQLMDWEDIGNEMNHASLLAPMMAAILGKHGLSSDDLGAVSISSGPGSFTGLRVGGSTAKALAYSLGIPLISVPTLEALSSAAIETIASASHLLPMIDARRDEVYTSLFNRDMSVVWPDHAVHINRAFMEENLNGLRQVVCCGDGSFKVWPYSDSFPNLLVLEELVCSARHLVRPAWTRLMNKDIRDPLTYIPSYLKPPNITQPGKSG